MNTALTQEIINHIFSGFSILKTSNTKFKSLRSLEYLLSEKLSFEDSNGKSIENNIWGVQFTIENNDLKVLLGDCTIDKNIEEYALLVKLKDNPAYGLYSAYTSGKSKIDSEPLIAVSVDSNNWMKCNTYFQATFLAGMEQAKDISYSASTCKDYKSHYTLLTSLIKYYNQLYEGSF